MRRELLEDLAAAHRRALEALRIRAASVRDEAWTHRESDDFPGCTE